MGTGTSVAFGVFMEPTAWDRHRDTGGTAWPRGLDNGRAET